MKERPILMSAPMVRAILAGSKTQTRRALRIQPLEVLAMKGASSGRERVGLMKRDPEPRGTIFRCKFGVPGDRLWVRETWAEVGTLDPGLIVYRADDPACVPTQYENIPPVDAITWKPSIHMFRRYSRILLEVVSIRVERLQEISHEDAMAEGMAFDDALYDYERLWEKINGPGSWADNPWVWVLEVRRVP